MKTVVLVNPKSWLSFAVDCSSSFREPLCNTVFGSMLIQYNIPQWNTAVAEIKIACVDNPELTCSPFKV